MRKGTISVVPKPPRFDPGFSPRGLPNAPIPKAKRHPRDEDGVSQTPESRVF
jgi:hypothetical protein